MEGDHNEAAGSAAAPASVVAADAAVAAQNAEAEAEAVADWTACRGVGAGHKAQAPSSAVAPVSPLVAESLLNSEPAAHADVPVVFQQTGFASAVPRPQPSALHVLKRMWLCVFFQLQPRGTLPLKVPSNCLSAGTVRPTCSTATTHSLSVKMP